jgi:hypothetical protein
MAVKKFYAPDRNQTFHSLVIQPAAQHNTNQAMLDHFQMT